MSRPIITAEGLSKAYLIGLKRDKMATLSAAAWSMLKSPVENFRRLRRLNTYAVEDDAEDVYWALKDVSFEIAEGEVCAIIGRNGAGKSTLLKLLSRITEPTRGHAVLRGRVSSLLEVGTGFHPELTGRENVYLNGTILGMTKREVDRKFDEIVEFSGIEKFLDTPIKRYSSGMTVRLAFAVAAHLEPEILIIDEVLAVGDAEFQKKCLGKMKDVAKGGRTVLFVSHNISAVRALCDTGLLLNKGVAECRGPIGMVLDAYLGHRKMTAARGDLTAARRIATNPCITDVRLLDESETECTDIEQGQDLTVEVHYKAQHPMRVTSPALGIVIKTLSGECVGGINTYMCGIPMTSTGEGSIRCAIKTPPLVQGRYSLDIYFDESRELVDMLEDVVEFGVIPGNVYGTGNDPREDVGNVYLMANWTHRERPLSLSRSESAEVNGAADRQSN